MRRRRRGPARGLRRPVGQAAGGAARAHASPSIRSRSTTTARPSARCAPATRAISAFASAGKVVARLVDVGVSVKKGDVLARLDEQDYSNRLKSAQADIVAAEAVLEEAQGAEGRLRQLIASGATTRANYDTALKNLRSAEAKLDSAKAARDLAKDQLSYAELRGRFRRHRHRRRRRAGPGRQRRPDDRPPGAADRQGRRVRHRRVGLPRPAGRGAAGGRRLAAEQPRPSRPTASCARFRPSPTPPRAPIQVKVTLKDPPDADALRRQRRSAG